MRYYVISYDLRGEVGPQDYVRIAQILNTAPDACKALLSFWIVGTDLLPTEIIRRLSVALDPNDGIVVLEITGHGDFFGAETEWARQWLLSRLTPA